MTTVAVTGRGGNLDTVLVDSFGYVRMDCDITSSREIIYSLATINPDIIINCAAITDVDWCETNTRESSLVNCAGVARLRENFDGRIIHISTDYIFDGKDGPYSENASPNPINWYGKTKLSGEEILLEYACPGDVIVRTTVLYGGKKPDFSTKVLRKLKDGKLVTVPESVRGSPTHVYHLAEAIYRLIGLARPPKIVNISGSDVISRYEFALMLATVFGYDKSMVEANLSKLTGDVAKRPKNAGLKITLAKKLGLPIYSTLEGINQLYVEKASIYAKDLVE